MKIFLSLILIALPAVPAVYAAGGSVLDDLCLTSEATGDVLLARDAAHLRRLAREQGPLIEKMGRPARVTRQGDIALLEANREIVIPANAFDLEGRGIKFEPRGRRYLAKPSGLVIRRPFGRKLNIGAVQTRRFRFTGGVTFPFDGQVYDEVWVNAIGTLTFGRSERFIFPDLEFLTREGPPRIVPLLQPFLIPSAAGPGGGIFVHVTQNDEIRVTWRNVPIGFVGRATFQVRMFPNGHIHMIYGQVSTDLAIVGLFPQGGNPRIADLDKELPLPAARGSIAEFFNNVPEINHPAIPRAFLQHFEDRYDYVAAWFDFPVGRSFYFNAGLRNQIRGIGQDEIDMGADWGSPERLSSYLFMNSMDTAPEDPDAPLADGQPPLIAVLGHEAGHRWLAFPHFRDPRTGEESDALLGRQLAHWSFNMDTDGSVMEGNDIQDNGDGTFTTVDNWVGYSLFDQYIMGFIPASDVPPFFFVDGDGNPVRAAPPARGMTLRGERVDLTIDDVIAIEGERVPLFDTAPNDFTMAFVLVTMPGEVPTQASIEKLDRYRERFEAWFTEANGGHGTIDTELVPLP